MAKPDYKKAKAQVQEEAEVVTNTIVEAPVAEEATPVVAPKVIFPEDMTPNMKLEDPKPVKAPVASIATTGKKVVIKVSGTKAIVGKTGEVVEVRGDDSVVLVGQNKYLVANSSLEQV